MQPLAITKVVKPDGSEDVFAPDRTRAFSDGVAYEVARILQNNVTGGTGVGAQIGVPVGGKTGTTDDYTDAWFVGFTPNYSTAVWMGYPNNDGVRRSMYNVHGVTVAGGTFPASIWADFMRVVVARDGGSGSFPLPNNPVSWSPFSSDFTRAAGEANSTSSSASTKSTGSTGAHGQGDPDLGAAKPAPAPATRRPPPPRPRRPPRPPTGAHPGARAGHAHHPADAPPAPGTPRRPTADDTLTACRDRGGAPYACPKLRTPRRGYPRR